MNISVITAFTPTPENRGGISALIYSIISHRPKGIGIKVYSYNMNNIPLKEFEGLAKAMNVEMTEVKLPKWYRWISSKKWLVLPLSVVLKRPLVTYIVPDRKVIKGIMKYRSDLVWVYPYFFYNYAKCLPNMKFIVTGCDCISNVGCTRFSDVFYVGDFKRSLRLFFSHRNSINVEEDFKQDNIVMHYVGMKDCLFYKRLHHTDNAFFLLHPHYELKDKVIKFTEGKLSVLFAGRYNHYMECETNEFVASLRNCQQLRSLVKFAFLGKDWEPIVEKLQTLGYECSHKTWVDCYADELIKYDVQIAPISNGGGTKGKVLDSIGNGLLTIGSVYAFENICVRDKESCLLYKNANEIPYILMSIALHHDRYERMAENGRRQVRTYHNPQRISKRFFEIIMQDIKIF